MAITISKEELDSYPGTRSMCQYDAIYINGAIVCQPYQRNNHSIIGIVFGLTVAAIMVTLFVKWMRKQDHSRLNSIFHPYLSEYNIFRNNNSQEEQLNPVPLYTANADPTHDFGYYDSNGNLVTLQKPLLSYQRNKSLPSPPGYTAELTTPETHMLTVADESPEEPKQETSTSSLLLLPQQPPIYQPR